MNYVFRYSELRRSEGGPGVADAVRAVKRRFVEDVTAKRGESPYVGHESLVVIAATKAAMRRALSFLVKAGYLDGPVSYLLAGVES